MYTNDGAGSFTHAAHAFPFHPSKESYDVAIVDLDVDGKNDLYFCAEGLSIGSGLSDRIWRNLGPATFVEHARSPLGVGSGRVEAADLDGDGVVDLLLPGLGLVVLPRGGGALDLVPTSVALGLEFSAIADLDGDGVLDVLTEKGGMKLWLGQGGGAFRDASDLLPEHSGGAPAVGDFDGDDDLDVLLVSEDPALWLNGPGGLHDFAPHFPDLPQGGAVRAVGDLDGDGLDDVLLTGKNEILLGDGEGGFAPAGTLPGEESDALIEASLADVDLDGDVDALLCGGWSGVLRYDNDGAASFRLVPGAVPGLSGAIDITTGDVDGGRRCGPRGRVGEERVHPAFSCIPAAWCA